MVLAVHVAEAVIVSVTVEALPLTTSVEVAVRVTSEVVTFVCQTVVGA